MQATFARKSHATSLTLAARTDPPDIRGVIREVIREIAGAAPPDDRDDDRETIRTLETAGATLRESGPLPTAAVLRRSLMFYTSWRQYSGDVRACGDGADRHLELPSAM